MRDFLFLQLNLRNNDNQQGNQQGNEQVTTATSEGDNTQQVTTATSEGDNTQQATTANSELENNDIFTYCRSFNNTSAGNTNNQNHWNVTNSLDIIYDIIEGKTAARLIQSNKIVNFGLKSLQGTKLFLGFNVYINDFSKHFNLLTLGNLIIKVNNGRIELHKNNNLIRPINISKTLTNIAFNFNPNNVEVYVNGSQINYEDDTPNIYDSNTIPLKIGSESSNLDSPDFYISDLRIVENYNLSNEQIAEFSVNPKQ